MTWFLGYRTTTLPTVTSIHHSPARLYGVLDTAPRTSDAVSLMNLLYQKGEGGHAARSLMNHTRQKREGGYHFNPVGVGFILYSGCPQRRLHPGQM